MSVAIKKESGDRSHESESGGTLTRGAFGVRGGGTGFMVAGGWGLAVVGRK